ncbi:AGAP008243-PA, partial [Anopheles gambiae str. PEST]
KQQMPLYLRRCFMWFSASSSSSVCFAVLRQDSELLLSRSTHNWSQQDLQQLTSSTSSSIGDNHSSAESNSSSTETLKWLGSMSDVSVASHATSTSALGRSTTNVRSVLRSRIQQNGELFASSSVRIGGNAKTCAQITLMRDAVISRKIPIIIQSPDIALSRHKEERSCHLQTPSHRLHKRDVDHRLEDVRSLDCPNQAACCTRLRLILFRYMRCSFLVVGKHGRGTLIREIIVTSATASSSSSEFTVLRSIAANERSFMDPLRRHAVSSRRLPSFRAVANRPCQGVGQSAHRSNNRLFPISTYTEPPGSGGGGNSHNNGTINNSSSCTGNVPQTNGGGSMVDFKQLNSHNWQSVAERINELEKHQQQQQHHGINLHSSSTKTHRVSNPSLKAFQKNAVISYFERQQQHARESIHSRPSSLNLSAAGGNNSNGSSGGSPGASTNSSKPQSGGSPPGVSTPVISSHSQRSSISSAYSSAAGSMMELSMWHLIRPPPTWQQLEGTLGFAELYECIAQLSFSLSLAFRTSSASEYSSIRDKLIQQQQQLSKDLLGPMIMGPIIALDDWVPERPPKNPMLRIPSPELPPPPPVLTPTEDVLLINQDEPLPPPPPELLRHMRQLSDSGDCRSNSASRRNSFAGQTNKKSLYRASTFENLSPANAPPPPGGQHPQNVAVVPPMVPKKPQQCPTSGPADGMTNVNRRPASSMAKTQTVPSMASTVANNGVAGMQPMHHHHHRMSHQMVPNGRPSQEQHQ